MHLTAHLTLVVWIAAIIRRLTRDRCILYSATLFIPLYSATLFILATLFIPSASKLEVR